MTLAQATRLRLAAIAALASLALGSCSTLDPSAPNPVIGSGRGLDHATVLTRSLAGASATYASLGFKVTPYRKYDNGFESAVIYLADEAYIELFGIHDREAVAKTEQASVLAEPDGFTWLNLHVGSTEAAAAHLRAKGHVLFGPDSIGGDPWIFKLAGLKEPTLPGNRVYVIEYNDADFATRPRNLERKRLRETHANTAQALRSAWIAVKDVDAAARSYADIGFRGTRSIELPQLNARAQELAAGNGTILLVHAAASSGPVVNFLGTRKDRLMGVSVKVASLAAARSSLSPDAKAGPEYAGPYGRSFLVPASGAGGMWVEIFE
jgi:hypothetical protein